MLQHTKLSDIKQLAASPAAIYANPAQAKTLITGIILHNTNTTDEVVSLYVVPDNNGAFGTPGPEHLIMGAGDVVPAGKTIFFEFPRYPFILTDTNDAIFAAATTANKVNVLLIGDKE